MKLKILRFVDLAHSCGAVRPPGSEFSRVHPKVLPGLPFSAYFLLKAITDAFMLGRQLHSALSVIPVLSFRPLCTWPW